MSTSGRATARDRAPKRRADCAGGVSAPLAAPRLGPQARCRARRARVRSAWRRRWAERSRASRGEAIRVVAVAAGRPRWNCEAPSPRRDPARRSSSAKCSTDSLGRGSALLTASVTLRWQAMSWQAMGCAAATAPCRYPEAVCCRYSPPIPPNFDADHGRYHRNVLARYRPLRPSGHQLNDLANLRSNSQAESDNSCCSH